MSFSFSFDLEADDELAFSTANLNLNDQLTIIEEIIPSIPHRELPLAELISSLPPLISFTPLSIPLTSPSTSSSARHRTLFRRDLFDARFQVMTQEEAEEEVIDEEAFIEKYDKGKGKEIFVDEATDLVKGVYEGGLKTWECSLDLVDCLDGLGYGTNGNIEMVRGKNIVELGCGTALPTCSLFVRLLEEISRSPSDPACTTLPSRTRIHLQDYNHQVLSLITLPNILLAFAQHITSPVRSSAMTDIIPAALTTGEEEEEDDSDRPGELEVTPELLESFEQLLIRENIELKFFEGDWSGMKVDSTLGEMMKYDIVLTSETIYSLPSLPSLLQLLKSASTISTSELSSTMEVEKSLCLVACKRIYFGVGGGELEFKRRVSEMGATVESIWGHGVGEGRSQGVSRVVMNVDWSTSLMV